jgi:uncharacterized membrane protein
MSTPRTTYAIFLVGTIAWCAAILLAPYFAASGSSLGGLLYRFFAPICHQLPERSFHVFGGKLAVCSRCSSVYFAFAIGVGCYPFIRRLSNVRTPHRNVLFIAMLPMILDVVLDFAGIHNSNFVTRTVTGALLGVVLPYFVLPAAIEGVQQLQRTITIPEL